MTAQEPAATWLEAQVERALARIESLTREVTHLQAALGVREQEVHDLRQTLDLVDSRSRRHEAGQDVARELRQAVGALEERLAEEAALRREQSAAVGRVQDREHESESVLERSLLDLAGRVTGLERTAAANGERQVHLGTDLAGSETAGLQLSARVEALAARLDALTAAAARAAGPAANLEEHIARLEQHARTLDVRVDDLRGEQQRLVDETAGLRRLAEREESLADLVEQQRALRRRLEEGFAGFEERFVAAAAAAAPLDEARRLVLLRLDTLDRGLADVVTQIESQREVLLDHFRRVTVTADEARRRESEEIGRQARAARELLVRLTESADEASREQPL